MKTMTLAWLGAAVALGLFSTAPVYETRAADDTPPTPTCKSGYVYSPTKRKCVRQRSEVVPDRDLAAQGWALARAERYQDALALFELVSRRDDPQVLNGLGYSHRKLGRLDQGIAYYKQALALDPDYVLAREYLGEGYVAAGRLDLARDQLAEIEKRCGTGCEAYVDLKEFIAAAEG